MTILIGIDEAGYGPNFGPLAVAATVWRVPDDCGDLYELLGPVVTRTPSVGEQVAIADSKMLYKPRGGLRQLERGVYCALDACGMPVNSWSQLLDRLQADEQQTRQPLPWHKNFDLPLPVDASVEEIESLGSVFQKTLAEKNVSVETVRARLIFPAEFNALCQQYDSKGLALSHISLELLASVLPEPITEQITVICDKHGGRNRYGQLLQHHFPGPWIETVTESRAVSIYRWGEPDCRMQVSFQTKGESFLPTALASMFAKTLRELSMKALNGYWIAQTPGLRPTAGYPQDARRFKAEIETLQRELGIADDILWRNR